MKKIGAELTRLRGIIRRLHEVLGESADSDDESLPDVVAEILADLHNRDARCEELTAQVTPNPQSPIPHETIHR